MSGTCNDIAAIEQDDRYSGFVFSKNACKMLVFTCRLGSPRIHACASASSSSSFGSTGDVLLLCGQQERGVLCASRMRCVIKTVLSSAMSMRFVVRTAISLTTTPPGVSPAVLPRRYACSEPASCVRCVVEDGTHALNLPLILPDACAVSTGLSSCPRRACASLSGHLSR